jgi:hypothetical protein
VPPRESRLRNLETGHPLFVGVLCMCVRCVCMCMGVCVFAPFARDNVCGGGGRESGGRGRVPRQEFVSVSVSVCLSVCQTLSPYLCIHVYI